MIRAYKTTEFTVLILFSVIFVAHADQDEAMLNNQDHCMAATIDYTLSPVSPAFDSDTRYYNYCRRVLMDAVSMGSMFDCRFGTYVLPAFDHDAYLGIYSPDTPSWRSDSTNHQWYIAYMRASTNLFQAYRKGVDAQEIEYDVQLIVEIPGDTARLLHSIWVSALLETSYSERKVTGLDGISYVFFGRQAGVGVMYGETWYPQAWAPAHVLPVKLVQISHLLEEYCKSESGDRRKKLEQIRKLAIIAGKDVQDRKRHGSTD